MIVADRRTGIGASEVAAIAGASPWTTPVGLWLAKVGLAGDTPDNGPMRAGRELEGPLLRLGGDEAGVRFRRNAQRITHPDWPAVPLYATPDGFGPGRATLAEVKLVGHRYSDWRDGPPDYVGLQVQAQLACVPRARDALVIALLGTDLRTYRVTRDPDVQRQLPELVRDWWQRYVVPEVAPDSTGPDDRWALLRAQVTTTGRPERLATQPEQQAGGVLAAMLEDRAQLDLAIEEARADMAEAATDCDVAGVGWTARWSVRQSVDWRGLVAHYGLGADELEPFTRRVPAFTFRRTTGVDA